MHEYSVFEVTKLFGYQFFINFYQGIDLSFSYVNYRKRVISFVFWLVGMFSRFIRQNLFEKACR